MSLMCFRSLRAVAFTKLREVHESCGILEAYSKSLRAVAAFSKLRASMVISTMIFLLFLLLLVVIHYVFSSNFSGKRIPPSPSSLPIIGHLHLLKKPLHRSLAGLSNIYGTVMLLRFGARPVLVVSSLSVAYECFTKNDAVFADRPRFSSMERLTYGYKTLGTAAYDTHWQVLRRIACMELFSFARVTSLAGGRSSEVGALLGGLQREWRGQGLQKMDLKPWLAGVALNIIMREMVGWRYDEEGFDARRFIGMVDKTLALLEASNLSDFLPLLGRWDIRGLGRQLASLAIEWDGYLDHLISEYQRMEPVQQVQNNDTVMGVLLGLHDQDPEYYNYGLIKALVLGLLLAGGDTSSATLEWAMALLINHPQVMDTARAEIDGHIGHDHLIKESDLPELPYLNAIVTETLRLYPPTPLLLPHQSIRNCTVSSYDVDKGTILLVNTHAIHRDPAIWPEPESFRPERFADEGDEDGGRGGKLLLMPFGMGRRRCPAERFSLQVVALTLGALIQCFEWEGAEADVQEAMAEGAGLTMRKVTHLHAIYRPRPAMLHVLHELQGK